MTYVDGKCSAQQVQPGEGCGASRTAVAVRGSAVVESKSMKACRVAQDEIRAGFVTFVLPEKIVEPTAEHPLEAL